MIFACRKKTLKLGLDQVVAVFLLLQPAVASHQANIGSNTGAGAGDTLVAGLTQQRTNFFTCNLNYRTKLLQESRPKTGGEETANGGCNDYKKAVIVIYVL